MIGTLIKKVTAAFGKKPCEGCNKRAEWLDRNFGRRGFIGGLVAFSFSVRNLALGAVSGDALPVYFALGCMRTINGVQAAVRHHEGHFGDLSALIENSLHGMRKRQNDVAVDDPEGLVHYWMKKLNFHSVEFIPGWNLDFDARSNGYLTILSEKGAIDGVKDVLITDQNAVIYHAQTSEDLPSASSLKDAKDFPGAVSYTKSVEPTRTRKDRFIRATFLDSCWGTFGPCPSAGCQYCITNCCPGMFCTNTYPTTEGTCVFNCGDGTGCLWGYNLDGCDDCHLRSSACGTCAQHFLTTCQCVC